jgi:hypothetical protein
LNSGNFGLPFNAESLKLILKRLPLKLDLVHVGSPRTVAAPSNQILELTSLAFGSDFNRAVATVSYPPANAQVARFLGGGGAEVNALHHTSYN